MTPLTIVAAALLLGLVVGSFAVFGAPMFVIPILLIAGALLAAGMIRRRREQARDLGEIRHEAAAEKVEFTERDRETLA